MGINSIVPIILCGGSGSRLWPLSRQSFPKQFLSIFSEQKKSLLQNTFERISEIDDIKNPILVCSEEHRFIVAEQMREIGVKPQSILLEPAGRNTCPAVVLAALRSLELEGNPNLLVLSSDHVIKNKNKFHTVIKHGLVHSKEGKLVTFGVIPTSPETGYGYIKSNKPFDLDKIRGEKISEFIEKPDLKTAKEFLNDKRFTWNSGIFLFQAKTILEEVKKFSPDIFSNCQNSIEESEVDLDFQRIKKDHFLLCPSVSIDIAIMEKTTKGIVLPLNAEWSDVGSWKAVWELAQKDLHNNHIEGKTIIKNTKGCFIKGENRIIAGIGLNDLIIIDTKDALLIVNKQETQKVKKIVEELVKKGFKEGKEHSHIYRPWGKYTSISEDVQWKVKLIEVKSGEQLSLQKHHHRSEHWIVVSGTAKVEIDEKVIFLKENQSTFIPLGAKHRLSNPTDTKLLLIEVQSGSYLEEDDIIRYEDKYGRLDKQI